uniref:Uncharacterized protein n=1 Tax=Tanacetum cinerariifolium TaxID=118510 RepID=A0A6L2N0L4_TANCI|nr:hypothetical protein [Tanacetum cinerariifolium]
MLDSKAYKEYYTVASGAEPPKAKTKYKKKAGEPVTSSKSKTASASKGAKLKSKSKVTKPDMKKQTTKKTKAKGLAVLSELALSEAEQIKLATKRSKKDFHLSHASGSDNGVDTQSKMTDANQGDSEQQNVYQESGFEQEEEDAHVTLTPVSDAQKADEHVQSSFVSFDFTSKFLNLENPYLVDNEIASLMETSAPHATVIFKITSGFTTTTPPPPPFFNHLLQQQTPTITTPTFTTITSTNPTVTLSEILNFVFAFKYDQKVSALEFEMSELKQTNEFAKDVSSILGIVDKYLASKMKEAVNVVVQLQTNKLREEAQAENQEFLNQVDSTKKTIIKDQVKAQVSKIMPKIKKYVTESLGAKVLVRSTNQPQTAYAVAASLLEFELKKMLIDKIEANKSINRPDTQKNLYNALVESYNSDKDIITSYGDVVLLKRGRDDQDKDENPSAGSDRGTKKRKSGKDDESSKDSSHTVEETGMQQDQEFVTGDNDEQPVGKEVTKVDWFKKPERPPTLDPDRSKRRQIDFRPPQRYITQLALTEEPPTSFDEFNDTSLDFSTFVLNRLKVPNLTQEILVGPAFNLLKGTCKSIMELEYHFEECSKATIERLNWHNPENKLRRIIAVTRLTIMEKHDYGHLEEIKVCRDDHQLYTFKEGDFKRLSLQDIKDMLLFLVQRKLTNLTIDERYDLNVALHQISRTNRIHFTLDPHGIIYMDQFKRKRLMRADELHKFSDGTLNDVRTALHDIAAGIRMEYLLMQKWNNLDKKRARVMVQDIEKQLYQRRLMRNLEMFVGGRIYGERSQASGKDNMTSSYSVLTNFSKNRRDLPRDIPLDSVGASYEVSVSAEGVEELKRKVMIKGEKKEVILTLRYEHVGPKVTSAQDGEKRLCLVDDLKKLKITFMSNQRYKSKPKVNDHYAIFIKERKGKKSASIRTVRIKSLLDAFGITVGHVCVNTAQLELVQLMNFNKKYA